MSSLLCCWCDENAVGQFIDDGGWKEPACDEHLKEYKLDSNKIVWFPINLDTE